jgi:hypothetical protein
MLGVRDYVVMSLRANIMSEAIEYAIDNRRLPQRLRCVSQ